MSRGFTLLELIIYIGITSLVLIAALTFAWVLVNDRVKQEVVSELTASGQFVLDAISYNVKRADAIDSETIYGTHPGKIVLTYVTNPTITIDTYEKSIVRGDDMISIVKLRLQQGTSPAVDITSDGVDVENFVVTNLSNEDVATIGISLTLDDVLDSSTQTYAGQDSWTTSTTLRKR